MEFFFAWERSDFDPAFTPDGKVWLDQDQEFWTYVLYIHDLWKWAEKRAENPVMQIRANDLTMDKL